ncbi:hypothetical protein TrLO_g10932 [Triparma laevis f. longispina]|uniref:Uncharacterized protein n=1 Tax=Triparma laevis f. longispina TaxID=1714387 RepID=A0A9W6ZUM8_9STRA|nr:hypothetical protein TrLO_g10932 [Triparma laevis f. longispina]
MDLEMGLRKSKSKNPTHQPDGRMADKCEESAKTFSTQQGKDFATGVAEKGLRGDVDATDGVNAESMGKLMSGGASGI